MIAEVVVFGMVNPFENTRPPKTGMPFVMTCLVNYIHFVFYGFKLVQTFQNIAWVVGEDANV